MKAALSLFATLSLFAGFSSAGTITIDWDEEIICEDPLEEGEVCHGKSKTLMGEDLAFTGTGSDETLLFDDEDTWTNCTLANSTVIGNAFDSTPDGEKKVKGGRYFALDESCSKRYKVIFKPKKFQKPAKDTSCDGVPIETDLGSNGKKCMKICKFDLSSCGGFQISGRGQARTCTFYENAGLGERVVKTKCRLAIIPKGVVLGDD